MIWFSYDCFSKSKERFELETHHHHSRAIDLPFPQVNLSLTASSYSCVYIIYKDVKCLTQINNDAKCEGCSLLCFLIAKKAEPIEICVQINEIYGDVMKSVWKKMVQYMFNGGRTNVTDEERSRWLKNSNLELRKN